VGLTISCSSTDNKTAPQIASQPVAVTVKVGQPASFSVTATGTAPLTYQWSKGGGALAGATSATYSIAATVAADAGSYTVTVTNAQGSVTSAAAALTVNTPPTITTQPTGATLKAGDAANLTVVPGGTGPFTYLWSKDGSPIASATSATYPIAAATASDAGSYTVAVSNAGGTIVSTPAVVVVNLPPTIATGPASAAVKVGDPVNLKVVPAGTGPFTFAWSKGGTLMPAYTTDTYSIPAASVADAGSYTVTVSNLGGQVTSAPAVLTVNVPPTITTQPAGATVNLGKPASFTVVPAGTAPFTFQWRKDGTALPNATSDTYPIAAAAAGDAGSYTVVVTNVAGNITSNAAVLVVTLPPTITTPPSDVTVTEGQQIQLSVVPGGTGPFTYQWNKGGTALLNATQNPLTIAAATVADAGSYTVTVTNAAGNVTSSAATVTVNAVPAAITADPQSISVIAPDGTTFSVTATGPGLTYVWMKNGTVIPTATNSTYTVPATDLHATADQYSVQVTSGTTVLTSKAATLTVLAPKAVWAGDPQSLGNPNYTVVGSYLNTLPADPTGSFRVGYDTAKLNPLWSAACFFPSAPWTFSRPSTYPTDDRIPGSLATVDYNSTGWSRGHQTGFADLRDTYGPDAGASTMYMTNMCPQDQPFNGGPWDHFETLCTSTYPAALGRVWVYTGPIFAQQIVSPIGAKKIPVPNAFFKVMVSVAANGTPRVLAAIAPNSSTIGRPGVAMQDTDFWKFVTSVDRVQELTGLTFFPSPTSPLPAGFTSTVDVSGWGGALRQGPNKPNVYMINPSYDTEYKHTHNSTNAVSYADLTTATTGTPVTFVAQASPDPDAIVSTSWSFGDGSAADPNPTTTHTFANPGNFTVTFSATDAASHTNSISRVVTIAGSTPTGPTISTIADVATTDTAFKTVNFTVSDAITLGGSITVTATSDTPVVLANPLTVVNDNGTCTLVLNPIAAGLGTATVTITATNGANLVTSTTFKFTVTAAPTGSLIEGFEGTGVTKSGYAAGSVTCSTGAWILTDALFGNTAGSDRWNGSQCVRMENKAATGPGKLTMNFNYPNGAKTVTVLYSNYGSDSAGTFGLWYSTDSGTTWTQASGTFTASNTTLATASWTINLNQPIRCEIRRTDATSSSGYRICFDDFTINGY
jgi:DNA/RNA endonuclease G (NUC1)